MHCASRILHRLNGRYVLASKKANALTPSAVDEDALIPCGAALPAAKAQMLLANKGIALFLYNYLPSGGFSPAALTSAAAAQTGLGAQMGTALPLSFAAARGAVSLLYSAGARRNMKIELTVLPPLVVRPWQKIGRRFSVDGKGSGNIEGGFVR